MLLILVLILLVLLVGFVDYVLLRRLTAPFAQRRSR